MRARLIAVPVPTSLLLSPIAPARTGNGLAMRAGMLLGALADAGPVDVVVVPVAGGEPPGTWVHDRARRVLVVDPVAGAGDAEAHVVRQLADPGLRARLAITTPLPLAARSAPPTLAPAVVDALAELGHDAVVTFRLALAPLGLTLARALDARRAVVDLDDDDEAVPTAAGDTDAADAWRRLARAWLPDADAVSLASPADADTLRARHELRDVLVVPNAMAPAIATDPPGADRILFVGNLTYAPNVDAVLRLAHEILPRVRAVRPGATATVVGRFDERLADLRADGLDLVGPVPDLAPWYARTDVVIVPLRSGSGTRIKVLEAFAHARPVVATPLGAAGLSLVDGRDVLLADDDAALAAAVDRVLGAPALARDLATAGATTLSRHYAPEVVAPQVRRLAFGSRGEGTT